MRSALLGVYYGSDPERRRQFTRASTEITHRDVRAEIAALAVAEVAAWMAEQRDDLAALLKSLAELSTLSIWAEIIATLRDGLEKRQRVEEVARSLGAKGGVSGYALQSVPVAIYAALLHRDDFETALTETIACGGDTDTVGAITGALVGTRLGIAGIPEAWRNDVAEYPHSCALLGRVAQKLDRQAEAHSALGPVAYFWPVVPLRNLIFLAAVLVHALRRLLPPY